MSYNSYTTDDLVALIKQLGHIPQSNATFTPAGLLTLADLELRTAIARLLKQANEGYFQTIVEHDQNDTGEYPIPSDAIVGGAFVMQVVNGQSVWPVSRQDVSEMTTTEFPSVGNFACFIRGNTIHMLPADFGGGVLRITYDRRPSKLALVSACAEITAINSQIVTVSSVPSAWLIGDDVDLQQAQPQFDLLNSVAISNISGTDVTLVGDLDGLSVGDFLCLQGQTCVPQVPPEFHSLLAQRVVCKVYELQGYLEKLSAAKKVLQEMASDLAALITPRTQAAPKVINPSWGGRKPGNSWAKFNPPAGRNS